MRLRCEARLVRSGENTDESPGDPQRSTRHGTERCHNGLRLANALLKPDPVVEARIVRIANAAFCSAAAAWTCAA